jgi:hypothetical protein
MTRLDAIARRREALRAEAALTRADLLAAARRARGDAGIALLGLAATRLLVRKPWLAGIATAALAAWTTLAGRSRS